MRILPIEGGESKEVVNLVKVDMHDELDWLPEGKKIVYASNGKIWIVSINDGESEEIKTGLDAQVSHLSCSPDGKKIAFTAYSGGDQELWLIEDFLP